MQTGPFYIFLLFPGGDGHQIDDPGGHVTKERRARQRSSTFNKATIAFEKVQCLNPRIAVQSSPVVKAWEDTGHQSWRDR